MKRPARLLAAAYLLDLTFGDPRGLPHPVRVIGAAIDAGERRWNGRDANAGRRGAAFSLALIGATALAGAVAVRSARRLPAALGFGLEAWLGATTLATRDLVVEAAAVADALESGDVDRARRQVARIVGRDTDRLLPADIARAAVETLAESTCDGIVAPLCWFAIGGVPAALAFKAASTLDSMIGHRDARFVRFGAAAARIDDALNFVPARLTALLAALLSRDPGRAFGCAVREARAHASPNAGWPESAFAGALNVRLGGENAYAGVRLAGPIFHATGNAPAAGDIRRAIGLVRRTSAVAALLAVCLRR